MKEGLIRHMSRVYFTVKKKGKFAFSRDSNKYVYSVKKMLSSAYECTILTKRYLYIKLTMQFMQFYLDLSFY